MQLSLSLLAFTASAAANTYVLTAFSDTTCTTPVETGRYLAPRECWENINVDPAGAVQVFYNAASKAIGWSNADCTGDVLITAVTGDSGVVCSPLNGAKPRSFSNPA